MKHIKLFEGFTGNQVYYDKDMKPLKLGDLVEVQVVTGRYGQTATYQGKITKMPVPGKSSDIELDNEYTVTSPFEKDFKTGKMVGYYRHNDYEHGHERYVKKITQQELNPKLDVPKKFRPTYTVYLVDYTNGKNKDKHYHNDFPKVATIVGTDKFEEWLKSNYPTAFEMTRDKFKEVSSKHKDWNTEFKRLTVHQSAQNASGYLNDYLLDYETH